MCCRWLSNAWILLLLCGCDISKSGNSQDLDGRGSAVRLILVDGNVIDFGNVRDGETPTRTIRIKNESAIKCVLDPIVDKSCGCTEAELSKTYLRPGEISELNVRITGNGPHGVERRATAAVIVKEPAGAEPVRIWVQYTPEAEWRVTPSLLQVSGFPGDQQSLHLDVRGGKRRMTIRDVRTDIPDAVIDIGSRSVDSKESASVNLAFRHSTNPGVANHRVVIHGGEQNDPELFVDVVCTTKAILRAVPAIGSLHAIVGSATRSGSVRLVVVREGVSVEDLVLDSAPKHVAVKIQPVEGGPSTREWQLILHEKSTSRESSIGTVAIRYRCRDASGVRTGTVSVPVVLQ